MPLLMMRVRRAGCVYGSREGVNDEQDVAETSVLDMAKAIAAEVRECMIDTSSCDGTRVWMLGLMVWFCRDIQI